MSTPIATAAHRLNLGWKGNIQWQLLGFMAADQDDQGVVTPNPTMDETEQLLDIDGLLKIAQLIREIKKDDRLNCDLEEDVKHADA